jgi:hypothetical protein
MKNTSTTKDFDLNGEKHLNIRFPCACGKEINLTIKLPKPNIAGDNFSDGVGQDEPTVQCQHGKDETEYNITVQVDPGERTGMVYIYPPIDDEKQLTVTPLP